MWCNNLLGPDSNANRRLNELFDTPAFLHAVANAKRGQVNQTTMQVFFSLSCHGHSFCVVFTCGLLQVIARTAPFDENSFFVWLAGYGSTPQNCLNAKAMEYHKFVFAGHQHANHQLWAAGICGLLRKSVGRLILRSSSCSRACFFCILPFPLSPYLQLL